MALVLLLFSRGVNQSIVPEVKKDWFFVEKWTYSTHPIQAKANGAVPL
jgi:hypothetical protein